MPAAKFLKQIWIKICVIIGCLPSSTLKIARRTDRLLKGFICLFLALSDEGSIRQANVATYFSNRNHRRDTIPG